MNLAARYGIKPPAAHRDPYPVDVTSFGHTHHVTCDALGISEEFEGSYTAALAFGRLLVETHLALHGPVKLPERPSMTQDELDDVFGGY